MGTTAVSSDKFLPKKKQISSQEKKFSSQETIRFLRRKKFFFTRNLDASLRYDVTGGNLGSTSAMTDAAGNLVGNVTRYLPFGGYRTGSGPNEVTDRGFTGHKHNDSLGLVYMNARFYVSGIGRFASADSIVPDPANPQSYNRYSYVLNQPIRYTDPTGHCVFIPPFDTAVCIALLALVLTGDTPAPSPGVANSELVRNPSGGFGCTDNLVACYQHEGGMQIRDFSASDNYVSKSEFEDLLSVVAGDLYRGLTPGIWGDPSSIDAGYGPDFIAGRSRFDTPFYNGGSQGNPDGIYPSDQEVCIEGYGCAARSEINYFAQGMWAAAGGDSLEEAIATTNAWIDDQYPDDPLAEGKRLWTQIGYEWYKVWLEQNEN